MYLLITCLGDSTYKTGVIGRYAELKFSVYTCFGNDWLKKTQSGKKLSYLSGMPVR